MHSYIINEQAIKINVASSFFLRLKGFLGKRPKKGDALLIVPCNQIHTFFMKEPIDVYYLNQEGEVVKYYPAVRPWRVLPPSFKTYMVLELGVGTLPVFSDGEKMLVWQE
ncbi:MAG: DUF192 domain-containing protein [Firmicutes bacterium]|nr:DUF192 domain-containing protein [Bacillota bacterium]MDD4263788.1 DUF192 domain-containing protein [Bacillota bacterium]MDD4693217.1 DUF192 domain-containing protein [Bacillota bacterium]